MVAISFIASFSCSDSGDKDCSVLLALHIKDSLHGDIVQLLLPQFSADHLDLIVIRSHDANLRLFLLPPLLGPVPPQLRQPVHDLGHLAVVVVRGAGRLLDVLAPRREEGERIPGGVGGLFAASNKLLLVEHITGVVNYCLMTSIVFNKHNFAGEIHWIEIVQPLQ